MNKQAENAIAHKKRMWKKYKAQQSQYAGIKYRKARNKCTKTLRQCKYSFERKVATEAKISPKAFWNYVNSQRKIQTVIPNLKKTDGTLTNSEEEKADVLNRFFVSVFTSDDENVPSPHVPKKQNIEPLTDLICTEEEVLTHLKNLNINKAPGPDNVHPHLLKEVSSVIAKPLTMLFNKSIAESTLPDDWKVGKITAIFKKRRQNRAKQLPTSQFDFDCLQDA